MSEQIKLGLLGNGISRSCAKYLHELLGEQSGLVVDYQLVDLADKPGVSICDELMRCQQEGFRGVNVTHPHKRDAFACVSVANDYLPNLISVNTVVFEDGRWQAQNTDYSGFCRAFRQQFGGNSRPGKVLMLGAGGVGLAIAQGLNTLGATELVLYDRQTERAYELEQQLKGSGLLTQVLTDQNQVVPAMRAADGLINATPLGMHQYPGSAFPEAGFSQQQWGFDAVYTPENTIFLNACRSRNIDTLSGFKLFLYQGLDAFRHFTGLDMEAEAAEQEFLRSYPLESL